MDSNGKTPVLGREDIERILPQREPFLFIDELIDVMPGKSVTGRKTFTGREEFFAGHFPGMPIVPGVIIVEFAAQVSACTVLTDPQYVDLFGLFAGVERFRFLKKVFPGHTLEVRSRLVAFRHMVAKSECEVYRDGLLVADGVLNAAFVHRETLHEGGE